MNRLEWNRRVRRTPIGRLGAGGRPAARTTCGPKGKKEIQYGVRGNPAGKRSREFLERWLGLEPGTFEAMAAARASLGRILPESSILFLCDMQEKLRDKVLYFPQIVSMAARMLKAARLLDVPVLLTEHYPKGLGPTVPELGAEGIRPVSKTCFSMVPSLQQELDSRPQLQSVLLCGIEAQGCILREMNRLVALTRMQQSGVFLSTSDVLILQLVRDSAHPQFKQIQKILKEPIPDIGLSGFFQGKNNSLLPNSRP
ncbi:Isochorismatase domain-containing protein 2B [Apodemus speciosus]|uniref:Isochorismatase domain-containing protein 2B n=1 Tax=Apodemus speciosus TaxID=105296 RepID=A0ABQ0EXH9_APOSI